MTGEPFWECELSAENKRLDLLDLFMIAMIDVIAFPLEFLLTFEKGKRH